MREFVKQDYNFVSGWMAKRHQNMPPSYLLPPTGLIVDNTAVGFLIKCDNDMGILDFFMSNPDIPKEIRQSALDDIMFAIILTAKRLGIEQLYCNSNIQATRALAEKHGFKSLGDYTSFAREL